MVKCYQGMQITYFLHVNSHKKDENLKSGGIWNIMYMLGIE
jgi:hypothetical protein